MSEVSESYMAAVIQALKSEQASDSFLTAAAWHLKKELATELWVASIAQALNSNQVPCVLWSRCLLNVHGVPEAISSVDFVIPDDSLKVGMETLTQFEGLIPCLDGELCHSSPQQRHTPPPAFHIHIKDSTGTVGLFLQSETLWFLPPIDSSLSSPKNIKLPSHFLFASDQTVLPLWRLGRGSGAFKSEQALVLVPKAHVLLEAFMRLYARDDDKRIGAFGLTMISYMSMYVDKDGFLDATQLPEPFKTLYEEYRQRTKSIRQFTDDLKEALGVPIVPIAAPSWRTADSEFWKYYG